MQEDLFSAFQTVIPKVIPDYGKNRSISKNQITRVKKQVRTELHNPNQSIYKKDMAEFILTKIIQDNDLNEIEEIKNTIKEYPFIQEYLDEDEIERFSESLIPEIEEDDEDFFIIPEENIGMNYLQDDPDWYIQIGLESNPFPSQDGLNLINEDKYDQIVTKTSIYNKYLEYLETNPDWILNRSTVLYGDFGCGKSTFFDFISYYLFRQNIFPIPMIMNATRHVDRLHLE